jgi:uncharacterized coiled-coil protein SlyX
MASVEARFGSIETQNSDSQAYLELKIMELKQHLARQSDTLAKYHEFQKESTKFQEKARDDFAKVNKRFDSLSSNTHADILASQDTVMRSLRELE